MKKWNFEVPRVEGFAPKQAHVGIPNHLWERELGRDGFAGAVAEFYHRNPPTAWSHVDDVLAPHLFDTNLITEASNSPWNARVMLNNADVRFRFWRTDVAMDHLVRNADGDELLFVHHGAGDIYCDFGHISLRVGDYLVIPKGCSWRYEPSEASQMLLIEASNGSFSLPDNAVPLGRHAPFDPGVFGIPALNEKFKAQPRSGAWTIYVKRGGKIGGITYPYNPLDAEGWKGDLYPIRLNVDDIRPIMSHRVHLVPSAYTTFVSERFVICTFVPKPGETDPEALKLPGFHDNIDYDEILFLHRGANAPQRPSSFKEGMFTFHPAGVTHGPHPNTFPMRDVKEPIPLELTFIMLDTRNALSIHEDAAPCDIPDYAKSWMGSINYAPDAK